MDISMASNTFTMSCTTPSNFKTFSPPQKETPFPRSTCSPFPLSSRSLEEHRVVSCLYGFACSGYFTWMGSYHTWPLVSGYFYSAPCFQRLSALQRVPVLYSFPWLQNIPQYGEITVRLSTHGTGAVAPVIVHSAAANMHVHAPIQAPAFNSLG